MGSDAGDLNNDGWLDFIASDMAGSTHYKEQMGSAEIDKKAGSSKSANRGKTCAMPSTSTPAAVYRLWRSHT